MVESVVKKPVLKSYSFNSSTLAGGYFLGASVALSAEEE